jgi:hypothetical protein
VSTAFPSRLNVRFSAVMLRRTIDSWPYIFLGISVAGSAYLLVEWLR